MKRGSPLKRGKRLQARHWRERWADRPDVYGAIWEACKEFPCFGLGLLRGHRCTGRHTAHHDPPVGKGGTDETGLLPCCEEIHSALENRSLSETRSELLRRLRMDGDALAALAGEYVVRASRTAQSRDALAGDGEA